jgi:hypothetical protein
VSRSLNTICSRTTSTIPRLEESPKLNSMDECIETETRDGSMRFEAVHDFAVAELFDVPSWFAASNAIQF